MWRRWDGLLLALLMVAAGWGAAGFLSRAASPLNWDNKLGMRVR